MSRKSHSRNDGTKPCSCSGGWIPSEAIREVRQKDGSYKVISTVKNVKCGVCGGTGRIG